MTQVYVDKHGYLWTNYFVALPHSFALAYECNGDEHIFNNAKDAHEFEIMLDMELLGDL
jgi:hypothetical protein